jgi:hypothetical protein
MYHELGKFARGVLCHKSIWTDGELWTALVGGVASCFWFYHDPNAMGKVRQHFGDLLSATSIIFGFVLAALLFYIQAAAAWGKNAQIKRVADKLVDWHVWTIVCMLMLLAYLLGLWAFGSRIGLGRRLSAVSYGLLTFQLLYCGLQILNHAMTVWWSFRSRDTLNAE